MLCFVFNILIQHLNTHMYIHLDVKNKITLLACDLFSLTGGRTISGAMPLTMMTYLMTNMRFSFF